MLRVGGARDILPTWGGQHRPQPSTWRGARGTAAAALAIVAGVAIVSMAALQPDAHPARTGAAPPVGGFGVPGLRRSEASLPAPTSVGWRTFSQSTTPAAITSSARTDSLHGVVRLPQSHRGVRPGAIIGINGVPECRSPAGFRFVGPTRGRSGRSADRPSVDFHHGEFGIAGRVARQAPPDRAVDRARSRVLNPVDPGAFSGTDALHPLLKGRESSLAADWGRAAGHSHEAASPGHGTSKDHGREEDSPADTRRSDPFGAQAEVAATEELAVISRRL